MPARTKRKLAALRRKAAKLLAEGLGPTEVAARVGVSPGTVRRWQRVAGGGPARRPAARVAEMLRSEGPQVARVLLDMAKGGDVRAAALVMKLAGNSLEELEGRDAGKAATAAVELERELRSLPAAIAAEIVGLLAQAGSSGQGERGRDGAAAGGGGQQRHRLPWQTEDRPSDEGDDFV